LYSDELDEKKCIYVGKRKRYRSSGRTEFLNIPKFILKRQKTVEEQKEVDIYFDLENNRMIVQF